MFAVGRINIGGVSKIFATFVVILFALLILVAEKKQFTAIHD